MKIAVIGAGRVGSGLAEAWTKAGHQVVFGVPAERLSAVQDGHHQSIQRLEVPPAIQQADVVLLAVPWPAVPEVLEANRKDFEGKLLVDATNPLLPDFSDMEEGYSVSGAERVAEWPQEPRSSRPSIKRVLKTWPAPVSTRRFPVRRAS